FDQTPERHLFPLAMARDIGVIARVPLDEGSLTGKIDEHTRFAPGDFRVGYFRGDRKRQVREHVESLLRDLGVDAASLPEIALRFCLSHPAVSTVIPGMRSTKHVAANTAASDAGPLSSEMLRKLREHRWVRSFY